MAVVMTTSCTVGLLPRALARWRESVRTVRAGTASGAGGRERPAAPGPSRDHVPRPDDDGTALQVRHLGARDGGRVVAAGLRQGAADAQLRAQDALGPDDGLLVAAGAGVRQAA